jgi:myosin heavy subunit
MRWSSRGLAACLVAAVACPAMGQDLPADRDALRLEYRRLTKDVRGRLYERMSQLEKQVAMQADLSDIRADIHRAEQEYQQTLKTDPKIVAAAKAEAAAKTAAQQAEADAAKSDPMLLRLKREHAEAEQAYNQAEFDQRLARFMLSEIRRRLSNYPEVRAKRTAAYNAERDLRELPQNNEKLAAASKAYKEARKAYENQKEAIPEYAAMNKTREAYEAKIKQLPQRAAMDAAKEAYEAKIKSLPQLAAAEAAKAAYAKLLESDPAIRAAKAAKAKAEREAQEELGFALAADTAAAQQTQILKRAEAVSRESRAKTRELFTKIREAERSAPGRDPKTLKARRAYESARQAHYKVVNTQTAKSKSAVTKLRYELDKRVRAKLTGDPRAALIQEELAKVGDQMKKIVRQMGALSKRHKPSKPSTHKRPKR